VIFRVIMCRFVAKKGRERETHKLLPGKKPVGHELSGSDCNSLVRHTYRSVSEVCREEQRKFAQTAPTHNAGRDAKKPYPFL